MALLGEIFGGGNQETGEGQKPMQLAVLGALAYHTVKNKGGLGSILGSGDGAAAQ